MDSRKEHLLGSGIILLTRTNKNLTPQEIKQKAAKLVYFLRLLLDVFFLFCFVEKLRIRTFIQLKRTYMKEPTIRKDHKKKLFLWSLCVCKATQFNNKITNQNNRFILDGKPSLPNTRYYINVVMFLSLQSCNLVFFCNNIHTLSKKYYITLYTYFNII